MHHIGTRTLSSFEMVFVVLAEHFLYFLPYFCLKTVYLLALQQNERAYAEFVLYDLYWRIAFWGFH